MLTVVTEFLSTLPHRLNPLREDTVQAASYQIDDIRQAMLSCLGAAARERFPHVERRILQASSVPTLWFLRPELLMAVAAHSGEQAARQAIDDLSDMFDGLLPQGLSAKAGGLRR
ncbi:MAG: hypothetical protein Q8R72_06985 [Hylemonella sp.]|nr:hypothetical protein [Hylemonella sp.]